MEIYKFAAMQGLLFPSTKGQLTVTQLFELPLTSRSGFDLDTIAKVVNSELKDCGEESFVESAPNPKKKFLEVALDIVKDVIATHQEELKVEAQRRHRSVERRKLLEALEAKKDQQLTSKTIEELEADLAKLDE